MCVRYSFYGDDYIETIEKISVIGINLCNSHNSFADALIRASAVWISVKRVEAGALFEIAEYAALSSLAMGSNGIS